MRISIGILFFTPSLYIEFMINKALEDSKDGVKVGGKLLTAVRYADDQSMIAHTNTGLQCIIV